MELVDLPFMHWIYPLSFVSIYALSLIMFWPNPENLEKTRQKNKNNLLLKPVVLIHNILLSIFSGYIFIKTFPQLLNQLQSVDYDFTNFIKFAYQNDG
ncbi:hypothetical protein HDU92_001285 [Lobulomyces angularis]|nr:hypothetical protein HDU92_001285 [Lobulomyces angularis]